MQGKFNFWTVERPFTRLIFERNVVFRQRSRQVILSTSPHFVSTNALLRTGGQFHHDFFEAKRAVHVIHHADTAVHFITHLLFCTEDVSIVLSEATNTHQAM
ncbi:hypothetical protein SRABI106_03406 [Rahnella aquatilis]|nr:hypothetical protein SRABI106_03406 [Rahnella aquatilis]